MKRRPTTSGTSPKAHGTNGNGSATPAALGNDAGALASRRSFLLAASASAGALLLGRRGEAFACAAGPSAASAAQAIGIQLYTLRDLMGKNFDYALDQVAAIGFKEVEFAGLFDKSAKKVREKLDKLGLTSPASHIPYDRFKNDLAGVAEEARVLGNRYVVCPWIDAAARRDAAAYKTIAADFNRFATSLQRLGLAFAYHNHDFEFAKLPDGQIGYDILLADCDPKVVKMELDLFWITKAGYDPLAYFAKWPGRFPLVHVKDMASGGTMVNVGQGAIDWPHLFSKRREAGIQHFFVEHDNPKSPLEDIRASYTYMAKLGL